MFCPNRCFPTERSTAHKFCTNCGVALVKERPPELRNPLSDPPQIPPAPCPKCEYSCMHYYRFCPMCQERLPDRFTMVNDSAKQGLDFVVVERPELGPGEGIVEAFKRNADAHRSCEPGKCGGHATAVGPVAFGKPPSWMNQ